jgi:predicted PhzF superfamily epimerase YddE/YHI9
MQLEFATLDVFTKKRFEGNPLAVVQIPADLKDKISQAQKQTIAKEFNLSETVFMHQPATADAKEVAIDIFTAAQELPFAGHPTIGSAVLARSQLYPATETLVTKAGPIALSRLAASTNDSGGELARAHIPHHVRVHAATLGSAIPAAAHGTHPGLSHGVAAVRDAELAAPVVSIVKGMTFALVRLPSVAVLGAVRLEASLDFDALPGGGAPLLDADFAPSYVGRYYYVDEGEDESGVRKIRSRMIQMELEDPATGSAASTLASYLTITEGRREASFKIVQGVEMGRRSDIYIQTTSEVDAAGNTKMKDVWLCGDAVVVQTGRISVDW